MNTDNNERKREMRQTTVPMMGGNWILITPALATDWLTRNPSNRSVSGYTVSRYSADMALGKWEKNPQPILFNEAGELRDGQHRLRAVVQSGCSVWMFVYRGPEVESARGVIDCGRLR